MRGPLANLPKTFNKTWRMIAMGCATVHAHYYLNKCSHNNDQQCSECTVTKAVLGLCVKTIFSQVVYNVFYKIPPNHQTALLFNCYYFIVIKHSPGRTIRLWILNKTIDASGLGLAGRLKSVDSSRSDWLYSRESSPIDWLDCWLKKSQSTDSFLPTLIRTI